MSKLLKNISLDELDLTEEYPQRIYLEPTVKNKKLSRKQYLKILKQEENIKIEDIEYGSHKFKK